jgi:O-acetyl-ADP-ribose deacetylase (regulator of RNase III)
MDRQVEATFLGGRVLVYVGDITQQPVAAIVNAANSTLLGGGGVDGAIHRMGGPEILKECRRLRQTQYPQGLPTGEVVITTAGNLPAKYVIHTVGPIYGRDRERDAQLLANCYENSLSCAASYHLSSIAFPSISTGAFGYPREEAAVVSSKAIKNSLAAHEVRREVRLVFFQPRDARVFLHYQIFE